MYICKILLAKTSALIRPSLIYCSPNFVEIWSNCWLRDMTTVSVISSTVSYKLSILLLEDYD